MNMELNKPNHLISLASSGVLVSVDVNVWSATKQDRGISNEVTTAKRADQSAGRYVKNLLADNPKHKAIVNYRQTVYNWVKRRTYRWNNSQDLLPSIDVPKFKQEYRDHETQFSTLVHEFLAEYDSIVSDMAFKQGDMFNRNDYPSREELVSKFGVRLYVSEVPMNDWRCNLQCSSHLHPIGRSQSCTLHTGRRSIRHSTTTRTPHCKWCCPCSRSLLAHNCTPVLHLAAIPYKCKCNSHHHPNRKPARCSRRNSHSRRHPNTLRNPRCSSYQRSCQNPGSDTHSGCRRPSTNARHHQCMCLGSNHHHPNYS